MEYKRDDWDDKYDQWKREQEKRKEAERLKREQEEKSAKQASQTPITDYLRREIKVFEDSSSKIGREIKKEVRRDIGEVKREFREVNDFSRPARNNRIEVERIIVVAIYVLVIGFAIYLVMASFFPDYIPFSSDTYTIEASDQQIFNSLKSFYIDDPSVLGPVTEINGEKVRPIVSSKKFNLVFKPKVNYPKGTNATLELYFVFNNSNASNIYLNDKLIFPSLANYELIHETGEDYIYARRDILPYINKSDWKDYKKTEEFLYYNIPGASVWSTRTLEPLDIRLDDYKPEWTLINTTFRGNLKMAVYAKDNLTINFTKQDLNIYLGQDEYTLEVRDYKGELIFNNTYTDDGDVLKSNKLGQEVKHTETLTDLKEGVYYIDFIKDVYNDADDSTVKNIKVSTNKIILLGNLQVWAPFDFYVRSNFPNQIGFNYWWEGKGQDIYVNKDKFRLNEKFLNEIMNINLTTEDNLVRLPLGYLRIVSNQISINEKNNFEKLTNIDVDYNNEDIILIDNKKFDSKKLILSELDISEVREKNNIRSIGDALIKDVTYRV